MSNAMPAMVHLFGGGATGGGGGTGFANAIKPRPGGDVVTGTKPAPNQNEDTLGNILGKAYNPGWANLFKAAAAPLGDGASVWPSGGGPGGAGKTLLGS